MWNVSRSIIANGMQFYAFICNNIIGNLRLTLLMITKTNLSEFSESFASCSWLLENKFIF